MVAAFTMAALATASVALWTLRVALAARGRKGAGALVAAVEAVVFATAFTRLASSLNAPEQVGGYAVGVAVGTLLGLALDERLSHGQTELRIVVPGLQPCLVHRLDRGGWPASWLTAEGPDGPVTLLYVAADDRRLPALREEIHRMAPGAVWTVQRLRNANESRGLRTGVPAAAAGGCVESAASQAAGRELRRTAPGNAGTGPTPA